ncbi:MAG: MFS transporter [Armatimonadetes bacterium]|nr:MFS transporter [Armatimonadota bacterium]NIM24055.1 MFS transporter [Armatimonadota bacterium]NIM67909.1 MFS transporter [Armatimonadota bacterium]NIM76431.1 MFS transporter [Armatimonadota bacterium]NIN06139.1 MFS transporter [Armatimonadota bacterium]
MSPSSDSKAAGSREAKPMRLPDRELRRCLSVILVSWGVFGSAWMSTVMGAPFPVFARALGASTFTFGLLSALRFLAVIAQIPGAYWIERAESRKRIFFLMHIPSRLSWLLIAALPWIVPAEFSDLRVGIFMILLFGFGLMDAVGTVAWTPWVGDIIPERLRARFWAQRQRLATLTAMIIALIVGWLLDRQAPGSFLIFSIVFAVAAVFGFLDIALYWRVPDIPMLKQPSLRLSEIIRRPLRDRRFRIYLIYVASSTVSGSIMGTFIWLYALEALKLSKFHTNLYLITLGSLATVLTARTIGALADRFGNRPVLTLAWSGLALTPILWVLATPTNHTLLFVASILGGACGGATMMLGVNLIFAMTPRAARSAYVAQVSLASGLAGFIAPVIAGAVAQMFVGVQVSFLWWRFGNLHLLLIALSIYRALHTILVVPRLPETRKVSALTMLKELFSELRNRPKT